MAGRRIRLRGRHDKAASGVGMTESGALMIEYIDFGDDAHDRYGQDVATRLRLDEEQACEVRALLEDEFAASGDIAPEALTLLELMERRFTDYFQVHDWLQDKGVPFAKDFDAYV